MEIRNEPEDAEFEVFPDRGNQAVRIYLNNGAVISFNADWNHGLGEFIDDYEAFLRGDGQRSVRYQMQGAGKKGNNHLNLKFETIAAIHLSKSR